MMETNEVYGVVVQIAIILIALFGGGNATVKLVSWLKAQLGTKGAWTQLIAVVVSVVLGLAGLIAEGRLTPETVQLENLSIWFLLIFGASQMIYRRLVDEGVLDKAERLSPAKATFHEDE